MKSKGQISLSLPITITLLSSFIGGTLWVANGFSKLNTTSAVLTSEVATLKQNQEEIKTNLEYIRRTLEEIRAEQKPKRQ